MRESTRLRIESPRLRILATNDFLGSFQPWPTTYGQLPGGVALRRTVDRFRSDAPTLWIDAGDFAQGGVISTRTQGLGGFVAMAELGPDVAVAGNHEFDWGLAQAQAGARQLGAPLLCANLPASGLPATATFQLAGLGVGVVGCTTADLFQLIRQPAAELLDVSAVIRQAVARLRAAGCDLVVAVVHDGVDWATATGGGVRMRPRRFTEAISSWAASVDVIVAGHTLGRWIGPLHGTPVLQPWSFGQEIGVVEFDETLARRRVRAVTPGPSATWTGHGADLIAAARAETVGEVHRPLRNQIGVARSLPRYVAEAMADANGCPAAIYGCWAMATGQPPVDGVLAHLPAGAVSEADVLRLVPYQDDSVVVTPMSARELGSLRQRADLAVWTGDGGYAGEVPVAVSRYASVDLAADLGRDLICRPAPAGIRRSLRHALGAPGRRG